jgi:hypothetical protein
MTTTRTGIPADITVIDAPAPRDAIAVATTVRTILTDARTAGLPMPDYVHHTNGTTPTATLHFTPATPHDGWEALRAWASAHHTTVTATESATRPGTYTARAEWHHDGIAFEAYAHITTPPATQAPAQ